MSNTVITTIGEQAFRYTHQLAKIKFPETLTAIYSYALHECIVHELSFGPNLRFINGSALEGTQIDKIYVSPQNTYFFVENGCLYEISTNKLVRVSRSATEVRSNVSSIHKIAFRDSYIETVKFDENLINIETHIFYATSYLRKIDLSRTKIKSIPEYNFYYLPNLKEVIFPETLKSLTTKFDYCPKFKTLFIPSSVDEIEPGILSSSNGIKNVVYLGSTDFSLSPINTRLATIYVSRIYPSTLFGNTTVHFYDSYNSILSFLYPTRETCHAVHHRTSYIFILYVMVIL